MVDTVRSVDALLTIFADNSTEDITPQDMRDFLVSALGAYGSLSVLDGSTQQDNPDTGAKLTCWDTNGDSAGCTPDHTTDDITIDVDGVWEGRFQVSFSGTASSTVGFRLRKDGVETPYGCTRKLGTGGDTGSASFDIPAIALIATNVMSIYVEMDGATDDLTVVDAQFTMKRVG